MYDNTTPEFRRNTLEFLKVSSLRNKDGWKLRFLHNQFNPSLQDTHDKVQARIRFLKALLPVEQGGMVELHDYGIWSDHLQTYIPYIVPCIAIVWSGRDCDGTQYANDVQYVDVSRNPKETVLNHIDGTYASADGPCNFVLMRPSEASKLKRDSRDLALEAFEDGHSHNLSSVRYSDD